MTLAMVCNLWLVLLVGLSNHVQLSGDITCLPSPVTAP